MSFPIMLLAPSQGVGNPVFMTVVDNVGNVFAPDSLAHSYTYTGSNQIQTDTCTDGVNTWTKTYTYTGSNLTAVTAWVWSAG